MWKKRRGRVAEGWFDLARAHAAAPQVVEAWREREAARTRVPEVGEAVTVRQLAHEWLVWMSDVKGASPATVNSCEVMLREVGAPAKRGTSVSAGRVMGAFGDRLAREVTVRDVAAWLRGLDGAGLGPRNVNQHRQLLASIFKYGGREDTYALSLNPVRATDKRREAPPGRVDYFEIEEVEALARAAAGGAHRKARGRARGTHQGPPVAAALSAGQRERQAQEVVLRAAQDRQDGELFRVLLYSGMRIGEARALRWGDVTFMGDMSGAVLDVRRTVSAGIEKPPKSWKPRTVPVPRPAAQALARLSAREHFVGEDDYVFVNRAGWRLEDSSIRRRYQAAREAAGLRPIALHGLRHAAGTMIATSAGVITARDVLGHAKIETTNRYLHGKTDARAIAAMNAAFGVPVDRESEPATG